MLLWFRSKIAVALSVVLVLTVAAAAYQFFIADIIANANKPDFRAYNNVKEKKAAFFSYLKPLIEQQNHDITVLRKELETLKNKPKLGRSDKEWLLQLAARYRLDLESDPTTQEIDRLLKRVEVLPPSLVLAQAAIESGWGTSRFAREGNNFFGQWCFEKGCGLVPKKRNQGANHEVAVFDTPRDAIAAYFLNINSHMAYKDVRELRHQARTKGQPIHGCVLAQGLKKYSVRGVPYINEVRQMIRINDLTPYSEAPCTNLAQSGADNGAG